MILYAADATASATVVTVDTSGTTGTTGTSTTTWISDTKDTIADDTADATASCAAIPKHLTRYQLRPCQKYGVSEELAVKWVFC